MHGSILLTEVLKLVVSAHICMSTQNGLVSLQCRWEVLKRVSFAHGCQVCSLHGNAFKQHRSKYTKNTNTESTYDVLAYLVPSYMSTGFPNQ